MRMVPGLAAREPFLLRVVITMVSLPPVFWTLMFKAFLLASPLNLKELKPHKLPGSADMTGMFWLLRMKELLPLMHSQMRSDAAGILTEARGKRREAILGLGLTPTTLSHTG